MNIQFEIIIQHISYYLNIFIVLSIFAVLTQSYHIILLFRGDKWRLSIFFVVNSVDGACYQYVE